MVFIGFFSVSLESSMLQVTWDKVRAEEGHRKKRAGGKETLKASVEDK